MSANIDWFDGGDDKDDDGADGDDDDHDDHDDQDDQDDHDWGSIISNFFRLFPFGEWLQLSGGSFHVYHDFVCEDIEVIDDDIDETDMIYDVHDNHDCDDIDDAGVTDADVGVADADAVADNYDANADADADADADMQESDKKERSPSRATLPPKSSDLSKTKTQPRWCISWYRQHGCDDDTLKNITPS